MPREQMGNWCKSLQRVKVREEAESSRLEESMETRVFVPWELPRLFQWLSDPRL